MTLNLLSSRSTQRLLGLALILIGWGSWSYPANQWPASSSEPLPLSQRVLVVYNATVPESLEVADYYLAKRAIPASCKCPITPPDTAAVDWSVFDSSVRAPIRDCLDAVGRDQILYIVFAYQTPYRLDHVPVEDEFESRSLDQYIADIWNEYLPEDSTWLAEHPYFAPAQSQGNVYPPFVSLAEYRSQPTAAKLYSVWRLDGATAELAKGLVDKARQAEMEGLSGRGYFDRIWSGVDDLADWNYTSGDWDLHRAAEVTRRAGFPVIEDDHGAEFGTPPAPVVCDQAALYAGWYAYDHYNDAFTWQPGAIGFHLDSGSALNPRGGTNWSANALRRGITVTSGAVSEPYLEGLPHADGVFRNLFEGATVGDAFLRNTAFLKWMVINLGDPLYRPFPGGIPPFNLPTPLQPSLALERTFVVGGELSSGTVTLASPASAGGAEVRLRADDPERVSVPPTITVLEGQTSASFTITTQAVASYIPVMITATYDGGRVSNTLVAGPLLGAVKLRPKRVAGGTDATGTVILNGLAPAGGVVITLESDNADIAAVPASVTISEGATTAIFTVTTSKVTAATPVVISASYGGAKERATLAVLP